MNLIVVIVLSALLFSIIPIYFLVSLVFYHKKLRLTAIEAFQKEFPGAEVRNITKPFFPSTKIQITHTLSNTIIPMSLVFHPKGFESEKYRSGRIYFTINVFYPHLKKDFHCAITSQNFITRIFGGENIELKIQSIDDTLSITGFPKVDAMNFLEQNIEFLQLIIQHNQYGDVRIVNRTGQVVVELRTQGRSDMPAVVQKIQILSSIARSLTLSDDEFITKLR